MSAEIGRVVATGQNTTVRDLAGRLGVSANTVTVNDFVGLVGGLLLFISYFVSSVSGGGQSASLSSDGGFWGAIVPILAAVVAAALVIPVARRLHAMWAALAAFATGIAIGSRALLGGAGYGVGWYLAAIGGAALVYGWTTHGRTGSPG